MSERGREKQPAGHEAAAQAWIDAWTRGWRDHDPGSIAARYADGALFVSHPFREPEVPIEYVRRAFAVEEAVEFWFAEPRLITDGAAVEYWATFRHDGGKTSSFAGVSVLRFDEAGLVVEHRDYWTIEAGERKPPASWLPIAAHARSEF